MPQNYLFDPQFARTRELLDTDPNRAWLAAQSLRDTYGWKNPELAAYEHEAYMRRAFNELPASTAVIGLPQAFGYPAAKAMAQAPWTQPLLLMATPGLRSLPFVKGLQQASPATWNQFGAGVKGYVGGLLDWLEGD